MDISPKATKREKKEWIKKEPSENIKFNLRILSMENRKKYILKKFQNNKKFNFKKLKIEKLLNDQEINTKYTLKAYNNKFAN